MLTGRAWLGARRAGFRRARPIRLDDAFRLLTAPQVYRVAMSTPALPMIVPNFPAGSTRQGFERLHANGPAGKQWADFAAVVGRAKAA